MRSFFVLTLFGITLATIAIVVRSGMLARKNPGRPINSAMRQSMEEPQLSAEDAMLIAQRYPNARKLPSGLQYVVVSPGTGETTPRKSQIIAVSYEGRLLNGTKFDASADHGGPFNFQVGMGRVIAGWDEALLAMKKGEKRTLIIPYWLGYGEKGMGEKIPPRATLIFEVELVGF